VKDVKDLIDQRAGRAVATIVMQRFKIGMAIGAQHYDFSIQYRSVRDFRQSRSYGMVTLGKWQTVPPVEPHIALIHLGHDAVAVPFDFEYPANAFKRLVNQRGKHWLDARGRGHAGCTAQV
jgi:hypothetical protein